MIICIVSRIVDWKLGIDLLKMLEKGGGISYNYFMVSISIIITSMNKFVWIWINQHDHYQASR
jgi:hypothetical protein